MSDAAHSEKFGRIIALFQANDVEQPSPQPRKGRVGVYLVETNFHVAKTHSPTACDVIGVVCPVKQLSEPVSERSFEPRDLLVTTGDDLRRIGMPLDLA